MGKTPKPLRFLVSPALAEWPECAALQERGHTVLLYDFDSQDMGVDVVMAPNAWRMDAQHRKYLPQAIAAARKVRYPKERL